MRWYASLLTAIIAIGLQAACQRESGQETVKALFTEMLQQDASKRPPNDRVVRVVRTLTEASPTIVAESLPIILQASSTDDEEIRSNASLALFAISIRNDSAELLSPYLPQVAVLLSDPNSKLQGAGAHVLANLRPDIPPGATEMLNTFIAHPDRNPTAQVVAITLLLKRNVQGPATVQAVESFFSRPMPSEDRASALGALVVPGPANPTFRKRLIASLDNPDVKVRLAAIRSLNRSGKEAVQAARVKLDKLRDEDASQDVRLAAERALSVLAR